MEMQSQDIRESTRNDQLRKEKPLKLNIGCDQYHLPDFINIDVNEKLTPKPDLILDITTLNKHYKRNSVDFIFAGHVFEHLGYDDSLKAMVNCFDVLKPLSSMLVVVPDYEYCFKNDLSLEMLDKILLANGEHKTVMTTKRLEQMLFSAGFKTFGKVPLNRVPYILVSNIRNPVPDPWQFAYLALKL